VLAPALSDRPSDAALACLVLGGGAGPWRVPLVRLAGAACELWPAAGRVAEGRIAEASWRADGERCVVSIELPCEPPEAASEEAYRRLFHVLDALGYPHLLRTWNYLPGITAGEGEEGMEIGGVRRVPWFRAPDGSPYVRVTVEWNQRMTVAEHPGIKSLGPVDQCPLGWHTAVLRALTKGL
ncbi:MAG: hypothetical protein NZ523_14935, partial [Elioraea sp.]|nr:hypothetical protein [Elioraea sp.]